MKYRSPYNKAYLIWWRTLADFEQCLSNLGSNTIIVQWTICSYKGPGMKERRHEKFSGSQAGLGSKSWTAKARSCCDIGLTLQKLLRDYVTACVDKYWIVLAVELISSYKVYQYISSLGRCGVVILIKTHESVGASGICNWGGPSVFLNWNSSKIFMIFRLENATKFGFFVCLGHVPTGTWIYCAKL